MENVVRVMADGSVHQIVDRGQIRAGETERFVTWRCSVCRSGGNIPISRLIGQSARDVIHNWHTRVSPDCPAETDRLHLISTPEAIPQ